MGKKPESGDKRPTSGLIGDPIGLARATAQAKKVAKDAISASSLAKSILSRCGMYLTFASRKDPAAIEQRKTLEAARSLAQQLLEGMAGFDYACSERVSKAYSKFARPIGDEAPSRKRDVESLARLEEMLGEAAGYDRSPTREKETLELRALAKGLALDWEQYTGQRFSLGRQGSRQGSGSRAGEWVKGIVAEVAPDLPIKTINGALKEALTEIRADRSSSD